MNITNITPDTNFNELTNICRKHIKDYEQYVEDLKTGKEEWHGYYPISQPTAVIKAVAEYGAENIFQIGADYHGKYEDDYCYFSYWNNVTGEMFDDEWTTAAACPHFSTYEWIMFNTAWENGLVDKKKYTEYRKKSLLDSYKNITPVIDLKAFAGERLKVKVSGGRKWKGIGYLVGCETSSYRYATPMFRNHCDGYGVSTTTAAKIYDPRTNTIERCGFQYVTLYDMEKITEAYRRWVISQINRITEHSFTFSSYSDGIRVNIENFNIEFGEFFKNFSGDYVGGVSIADSATDIIEEERKKKAHDYKVKQMESIIAWIKEKKPEMTDEFEIISFAEYIFWKNNNK